jgi:hypothetical protein
MSFSKRKYMSGGNSGIDFLYLTVALAIVAVPAMAMTAYSISYKEYIK